MRMILRGCQKCGGDVYEQVLVGHERERSCLQCGWRGNPRRALPKSRPNNGVTWTQDAVEALARVS